MSYIDFSLLLQRKKKKVYALSLWVYFYLGDILDEYSIQTEFLFEAFCGLCGTAKYFLLQTYLLYEMKTARG